MPAWPGSLPQKPLLEGLQEQAPTLTVRTQMDAGPPKIRKRFTAGIRLFSLLLSLTKAQVETLDVFFVTTSNGGATPFDWTHPRTAASVTFRFVSPPAYHPLADDVWRAQLELEILP